MTCTHSLLDSFAITGRDIRIDHSPHTPISTNLHQFLDLHTLRPYPSSQPPGSRQFQADSPDSNSPQRPARTLAFAGTSVRRAFVQNRPHLLLAPCNTPYSQLFIQTSSGILHHRRWCIPLLPGYATPRLRYARRLRTLSDNSSCFSGTCAASLLMYRHQKVLSWPNRLCRLTL